MTLHPLAAPDAGSQHAPETARENRAASHHSNSNATWQRYGRLWRGGSPSGVFSVDYLRPPLSKPLRVHLRALVGWDQPLRAAATALPRAWRLARWYGGGRRTAVARIPDAALERYATAAGMTVTQLRERLDATLARHTLAPRDALGYGLVVDLNPTPVGGTGTHPERHGSRSPRAELDDAWPLFLYDSEEGWNLAASLAITSPASGPAAAGGLSARWRGHRRRVATVRAQIAALSDKEETARRLAAAGVPTVPSLLVPARVPTAATAGVAELIRQAVGHWPGVDEFFVKPRAGSRGLDSFVIVRAEGAGIETARRSGSGTVTCPAAEASYAATCEAPPEADNNHRAQTVKVDADAWVIRRYHADSTVDGNTPGAGLSECLRTRDYLVQPLLRTAEAWQDVAADSDVVTVRLVTRDTGRGPAVFSRVVEIPLSPSKEGQYYLLVAVDSAGAVDTPALPLGSAESIGAEARDVWERVAGRSVPHSEDLDALAVCAHRLFPGIFAVAWDIALTDDGPRFLEGNAGFGTFAPQVVAGGLLDDVG